MSERAKTATLSKAGAGWCAIFRHPVCKTPDGREYLRVRRGLGTRNQAEAEQLLAQLNAILSDHTYWSLAARELASRSFDKKIVAAFYDHMAPAKRDHWQERENVIRLPGGKDAKDGYARAMLIGTTGAGKTTVLRQLIGTDPTTERFPSISAAKTTVSDLEIVLAEGPYRAVVSFIDRDLVHYYISECVLAAVIASFEGRQQQEVVRRLLEHSEQRFRLSYLLGTLELNVQDELSDEDEESNVADESDPLRDARAEIQESLQRHLDSINLLAEKLKEAFSRAAQQRGLNIDSASQTERDALQEIVEDEFQRTDQFHAVVDNLVDDVESRFSALKSDGKLTEGRDGWPMLWTYESTDRQQFLRIINRFSSNFAGHFGRLLTPLVEGIRVIGPFSPGWGRPTCPRLVLLDGQGLGHTADSTSSLSTKITSKFPYVDAIVLVDNAAQPMQSSPCAAVETLVSSGNTSKLILCFTHFDEVKGDNLVGPRAKIDHVLGSWDNVVNAIAKTRGRDAESALRRITPDRVVFLSNVQEKVKSTAALTRRDLDRLVDSILKMIVPHAPVEHSPIYDIANLVLSIQAATYEFHDRWHGLLNLGSRSGVRAEHWARIKALTRRLGFSGIDEYDGLRPVGDLIRKLQDHIRDFLSNPSGWTSPTPPDSDIVKNRAVSAILQEVNTQFHELARARVLNTQVTNWSKAFEHRGEGSTRVRARDIVGIFQSAAPIPNETRSAEVDLFIKDIRTVVVAAIRKAGGRVIEPKV